MDRLLLLFFVLLFCLPSQAQEKKDSNATNSIAAFVFLDSFVVTAKREGFNVEEFIELVQKDESFFKAFQNLRIISYKAENKQTFYDKRGQTIAGYESLTEQFYQAPCRTMAIQSQSSSGTFYKKNKKYKFYTSKMFDQVFFTHGKVCTVDSLESTQKLKGIQKHINELKKLIFQPGQKVDVPIIGGKTAIFTEKMIPYYNYSITQEKYRGRIDAYSFIAEVKPEFKQKKEGKTIIKYLKTYFERKTFQVLGREYRLQYQGALFDFDVQMEVELKKLGNLYIPEKIRYKGAWDIPTKKPENGTFEAYFYDFK